MVETAPGATVIQIRGEDLGRLVMTIARIALTTSVRVMEPHDVAHTVERLGTHLTHQQRS